MGGPIPESELIQQEILIRDLQLTKDARLTKKSLVRWLALALGLVSPNESRTTMIDLLETLIHFQLGEKTDPDIHDIMEHMQKRLRLDGANEKAVRYHLLYLKNLGLIDRKKGRYSFATSPLSEKCDLLSTIDYVYRRRGELALSKVKDAVNELKAMYR